MANEPRGANEPQTWCYLRPNGDAEVRGIVVSKIANNSVFLESVEGMPNIYVNPNLAANLKMGQTVTVLASMHGTKYKAPAAIALNPPKDPRRVPFERVERDDGEEAEAGAAEEEGPPQNAVEEFVLMGATKESAEQAWFLFEQKYTPALNYLVEGGHIKLVVPSGRDADLVVESIKRCMTNGEMSAPLLSKVYVEVPLSKVMFAAWCGLQGFCTMRSDELRYVRAIGKHVGRVILAEEAKGANKDGANAKKQLCLITGSVTANKGNVW